MSQADEIVGEGYADRGGGLGGVGVVCVGVGGEEDA